MSFYFKQIEPFTATSCPKDEEWEATENNKTVEKDCLFGLFKKTRKCVNGKWEEVDDSDCSFWTIVFVGIIIFVIILIVILIMSSASDNTPPRRRFYPQQMMNPYMFPQMGFPQ